jgi:3-deoxy-D-manno-octulosonate 8-phosphate phosphatase (KDO 8-P phosphatase)
VKRGIKIAALSGARSKGVEHRLKGLGIQDVFLGLDSKIEVYQNYLAQNNLSSKEILFVGDDMPDLQVMKLVGLAVCPADAVEEIKAISHYISPKNGGEGCVRDIVEKVLKIQNLWFEQLPSADDGSTMI